ncbi:hypothetical protein [Sinomonas soli]
MPDPADGEPSLSRGVPDDWQDIPPSDDEPLDPDEKERLRHLPYRRGRISGRPRAERHGAADNYGGMPHAERIAELNALLLCCGYAADPERADFLRKTLGRDVRLGSLTAEELDKVGDALRMIVDVPF